MAAESNLFEKLTHAIAAFVVLPLWTWLAVSTQQCLRVITRRTIPFSKRTIWLVKVFSLVIGAGGVFGLVSDLGTSPYYPL